MSEPGVDWTPFLALALLLAFIAAQHWLLCVAVLLVWERLLQIWYSPLGRGHRIPGEAGS